MIVFVTSRQHGRPRIAAQRFPKQLTERGLSYDRRSVSWRCTRISFELVVCVFVCVCECVVAGVFAIACVFLVVWYQVGLRSDK